MTNIVKQEKSDVFMLTERSAIHHNLLLQCSGRNVGIISHAEELRERIPVQIQVNWKSNHSGSTIKIIPEE